MENIFLGSIQYFHKAKPNGFELCSMQEFILLECVSGDDAMGRYSITRVAVTKNTQYFLGICTVKCESDPVSN